MPHRHPLVLGSLVALAAGCAATTTTPTTYAPAGADRWNDGYRSLLVPTPAAAPRGSVEVASFGLTELALPGGPTYATLHLRLVVANTRDEVPWSVDVGALGLDITGEARRRPMFVNSDVPTLPIAILSPGERATLDAYFPLPTSVTDEEDLEGFEVEWVVRRDGAAMRGRASLGPDAASPSLVTVARAVGWGSAWWCDPAYPWPRFERHSGPIVHKRPDRALVVRPPSRHAAP